MEKYKDAFIIILGLIALAILAHFFGYPDIVACACFVTVVLGLFVVIFIQ